MFLRSNTLIRNAKMTIRVSKKAILCNKLSVFSSCLHRRWSSNTRNERISPEIGRILKSPLQDIDQLSMTIHEYVWRNVERWPNHKAIVCGLSGKTYTYRELQNLSNRFACSLRKCGFNPGDILAIMLPNIPEYAIMVLGALEAGVIISTINPAYTTSEILHQVKDCGAIGIITNSKILPRITSAKHIIQSKEKKNYPLYVIVADQNTSNSSESDASFQEMISSAVEVCNIDSKRDANDIAVLPYSSGTTGLSKGVQLTHSNIVSNLQQYKDPTVAHVIETTGKTQDVIPAILPFFHIYGFAVILLYGLSSGCKIVTLPKFVPFDLLSILKDHKATILYAAPPMVLFLGYHESVKKEHFTYLRHIVSGAGPVTASDVERIVAKTTNKEFAFSQGYGLTEASPIVFIPPKGQSDYSSVGIAVPSTFIKVVKEDGSLASDGENGEICVKGPQVMKGYHKNLKATQEIIDNEGFLHTGDVGFFNKNEMFLIVDRIKDLIKVKGFQVPPAELEGILRDYPGVSDAAVIGVPDERTGEKPIAFIVKKTGTNLEEDSLLNVVAEKVAPYKRLGGIIFVESIPKNPSGKILKRILRQNYLKH